MDAVHIQTSTASQMEHQISPKIHMSSTSSDALNGKTAKPTDRSAMASETMNKLVTVRSLESRKTANTTRQLPNRTSTLTTPRMTNETMRPGWDQSTSSSGLLQLPTAAAVTVGHESLVPSSPVKSDTSNKWRPSILAPVFVFVFVFVFLGFNWSTNLS